MVIAETGRGIRAVAQAWLEQAPGERRYVERETTIGRGERNNICLTDPSVSRYHALIRRGEGGYLISDLGSANGTFVNGARVYVPRLLAPGDRLKLANVEFTFQLENPDASLDWQTDARVAAGVSQFLTTSGELEIQNYHAGDLRVVSIVFVDLCGFTSLSAKMSPEQVTLVINQCFQHLTDAAVRFGGYVDKYIGDEVMVLFGAPEAHEDDAERAVRAAIAMQQALKRFSRRLRRRCGVSLDMRVGVNTGEVLAGQVGIGQFSAFTVMGDSVNVASRLEHAAQVGSALAGESTYLLTRHLAEYVPLPPMELKGKSEPVPAFELVAVDAPEPTITPDDSTAFIGREQELERLASLFVPEQEGFNSGAIVGTYGSGKSRLFAELRRQYLASARWAIVSCSEFEQQTPYATVRRLARALLATPIGAEAPPVDRTVEMLAPGLLELLTADDPDASTDETSSADVGDALTEAFTRTVRSFAESRRVVLALDGAEWIDERSLAILVRIANALQEAPVTLLTSWRTGPTREWPNERCRVRLEPFSAVECEQFIADLLQSDQIDSPTLALLTNWSAGNPLILDELMRTGLRNGSIGQIDGSWRVLDKRQLAHAPRLRSIIQAAIDRLPSEERQLLHVAAVVDSPWTRSYLVHAMDTDSAPFESAFGHLVEASYFIELRERDSADTAEAAFGFANELVREVIEASLPELERRRLNERVAIALQRRYDPARPDPKGLKSIARHLADAGQSWRAVEYLLRAADVAAAQVGAEAAVAEYWSVLDQAQALKHATERARLIVEIQERIGDTLLRTGSLTEAQIAFESATQHSTSKQRRAELQCKLATAAARRGNYRHALELMDGVLEAAEVDQHTYATAEALAAISLAAMGNVQRARERAERALSLATGCHDASVRGLVEYAVGRIEYQSGALAEAVAALEQSVATLHHVGDRAALADSQIMLGLTYWALGDFEQAEAAVTRIARDEPPDRWTLAWIALVLARVLFGRGETQRGVRHLTNALQTSERLGARELALQMRADIAAMESTTSSIDELRQVMDAAAALKLDPLACSVRIQLSNVLSQSATGGNATSANAREAADLAQDALGTADKLELRLHAALAHRALGLSLARLADVTRATAELDRAAADLEGLGARGELARTLADRQKVLAVVIHPT